MKKHPVYPVPVPGISINTKYVHPNGTKSVKRQRIWRMRAVHIMSVKCDLCNIFSRTKRKRWPMGGRSHQSLWGDLQTWPLDLGIFHLRLTAGLLQVDVLIADVLLLASAKQTKSGCIVCHWNQDKRAAPKVRVGWREGEARALAYSSLPERDRWGWSASLAEYTGALLWLLWHTDEAAFRVSLEAWTFSIPRPLRLFCEESRHSCLWQGFSMGTAALNHSSKTCKLGYL